MNDSSTLRYGSKKASRVYKKCIVYTSKRSKKHIHY